MALEGALQLALVDGIGPHGVVGEGDEDLLFIAAGEDHGLAGLAGACQEGETIAVCGSGMGVKRAREIRSAKERDETEDGAEDLFSYKEHNSSPLDT